MSRLEIQGVRKAFGRGGTVALADVDIVVPSGRSTVVLGQSGSGKSTLLRIVAGLLRADAGRVVLADRVLSDPRLRVPPEQRRIGMVFQALELWPHMTVAEHVAFGLPGRPRGRAALAHAVVRRIAEEVGLPAGLLARRPETLSGGERQRVAIARTLAAEPAVILYDEPLASLDPGRRTTLRQLIRRLAAERGTTILYVTHDADEAVEMGDEIVVLEGGRVAETGDPETLYRRPRTLAGARALGAVNALAARMDGSRVQTALGAVEVLDPPPTSAPELWAVVRPEHVVPDGDGVEATVEAAHFHGDGWRFVARTGTLAVEGRSAQPLQAGQAVSIRVDGPVAVIQQEPSA